MPEKDPKLAALRQQGTLNPRPGKVSDALFVKDSFFDSRDLVQDAMRQVVCRGRADDQPSSTMSHPSTGGQKV